MDSLDDSDGGVEWWQEQVSEKAKEKASKSIAWIQKTRKDEQKAQRDNDYLHICLREIITSRRYDTIIPFIFPLFDAGIPSHIVIGGFSLIHGHASDIIQDHYTQANDTKKYRSLSFAPYESPQEFDDQTLEPIIRKRINEWIEDIFSIISYDPSSVMTDRFKHILWGKEKKGLVQFLSQIFIFFLRSLNIHISENKSVLYSDFILEQVEKKIKNIQLESI